MSERLVGPAALGALAFSFLAVLWLAVAPLSAATGDFGDSKEIDVPLDRWSPGQKLELRNLAGRMVLSGGGEPSLKVVIHAQASSGLSMDEILGLVDVRAEQTASGLVVTTDLPLDRFTTYAYPAEAAESGGGGGFFESWFGGFSSSSGTFDGKKVKVTTKPGSGALGVWADYRLVVPAGREVTMNNFVGSLEVDGADGTFLLDTGSGDVTVCAAAGSLTVDTGSGNVKVDGFSGSRLAVDTGSGDVAVSGVAAEKLVADTGSGDVTLRSFSGGECVLDTGSGDVTVDCDRLDCSRMMIDTGSGDVVLALPAGAPFSLRADTGSGEVTGSLEGASPVMDDDELVGFELGSGGPTIEVDTGSGDVQVKNR